MARSEARSGPDRVRPFRRADGPPEDASVRGAPTLGAALRGDRLAMLHQPPEPPRPRLNVTATVLAATARLLSGASVRWIGAKPEPVQRIYFANHTSHLDPIVLWASLPHELRWLVRPVAARDYWEADWVRRYMAKQVFNALLIDRENIKVHKSPVDEMLRAIGTTHSLIVFPEGGRRPGPDVGEFKSGLYYLAKKRPDLELIPVHIDNMNRILPRGEFLPVPLLSCITFGPPLYLEPREPKVEFLRRARDGVRRLKDIGA